MTLKDALVEHTGCTHKLSIEHQGQKVRARHGNEWGTWLLFPSLGDVQAGSAVFHGIARWVIQMDGHKRVPMHITDDEYASFGEMVVTNV